LIVFSLFVPAMVLGSPTQNRFAFGFKWTIFKPAQDQLEHRTSAFDMIPHQAMTREGILILLEVNSVSSIAHFQLSTPRLTGQICFESFGANVSCLHNRAR